MPTRYEDFYIKLGDNNENQCSPYSSIVSAANWNFAVWAAIERSKNVWHYITLIFSKIYLGKACCPAEYNSKVSRLAIFKIIRTNIKTEPGCHLYCIACKLVLLSHFNMAKLFTDYLLFSPVTFGLLYWKWVLKQIFCLSLCCIIISISGIIDHY